MKGNKNLKTALFIGISFISFSCVRTIHLPVKEVPGSSIPDVWREVELKSVNGADTTYIVVNPTLTIQIGESPTSVLKRVLISRLGKSKNRQVFLYVENVHYAINANGSFGIGADFILKRGNNTKRISLEHSVNVPVGVDSNWTNDVRESVISRAVMDLTDILFFNADALAFLNSPPVELEDSALLANVDVGPVVPLKSSRNETSATGRILWGSGEREGKGEVYIMLGDAKGAFGYYFNRNGNRYTVLREGIGFGGVGIQGSGMGALYAILGVELGYHGTKYTRKGYVDYPGYTFILVPQLSIMEGFTSDAIVSMFLLGGSIEFDIPIIRYVGITGGFFVGSGVYAVTVDSNSFSDTLPFIYYPFGDIYIQTSVGRISLGATFQQLVSSGGIGSAFDNPTITISYEYRAGRGLAYSKSDIAVGDWSLRKEERVFSYPNNVFLDRNSIKINPQAVYEEE